MTRVSYDEVCNILTTDKGLSLANRAYFHAFNPNGLIAKLNETQKRVDAYVDVTPSQPNGAIIVYGTLNTFAYDNLFKIVRKRRINGIELRVALSMIERDIKKANDWLEEKASTL